MCRAFGKRPSEVLLIDDLEEALDFDLAMNMIHREERVSRIEFAAQEGDALSGLLTAATFED